MHELPHVLLEVAGTVHIAITIGVCGRAILSGCFCRQGTCICRKTQALQRLCQSLFHLTTTMMVVYMPSASLSVIDIGR